MHTQRHYHSLAGASEAVKRKPEDLVHYAVQGKLTLLVGVPDSIVIRVYDETTNSDIEPFLITPQFLALSQSQCLKVELHGRTVQSDFPDGYCLQVSGELHRVSPTYGYPNISQRWSFWRTYLDGTVHPIVLAPHRLFVMHSDLENIIEPAAAVSLGECSAPANLLKENEGGSTPVRATEFRFADNSADEQANVEIAHDTRQPRPEKTMEPATCPAGPKNIIKGDFHRNSARDTPTPNVINAKAPAEPTVAAKEALKQPKTKAEKPIPLPVEPTAEKSPVSSESVRDRSMTILRLKQVLQRTGLSRSTIYDKMNPSSPRFDHNFPKKVSLGANSVGWLKCDLELWIESRGKS